MMNKTNTLTNTEQAGRTSRTDTRTQVPPRRFEAPRLEVVDLPAITAGTHTWGTTSAS